MYEVIENSRTPLVLKTQKAEYADRHKSVSYTHLDYRQPVDFWIQVVGGIGIHDSLWRSVYGGSEYLNAGSHGCINTPYDAVSNIYWNIDIGVPVVMYY